MVGEREEKEEASVALDRIRAALSGLRFGTVMQDGVVVQVERTEKVRIARKERC